MIGLSGVLLTSVGAFALAGALFGFLHSRRPSGEHRLVAVLAVVCAMSTLTVANLEAAPTGSRGSNAALAGRLGLLLAFGLVAQLGLRGAPTARTPRVALAIQVALACTACLDVARSADARLVEVLATGAATAAAGLELVSASRAYIAGRKELGGVIFGSGVLAVTTVHEGLYEAGLVSTGHLAPFGFLALVSGYLSKLVLEHTDIRRRLDERKRELRSRTRELRNSHHKLMAAEAELSTKEQLAAVGELAAVVAHEVRNPLAILGNAVSSLRKPNIGADDRSTLLEIIDSEASRLNRIVTDLLSFSRPITVQRVSVDLGEIIERTLSLATHGSALDAVTVDLQIAAEGARVWADGNLLRQVFDNLIANALQAMDSGGTLTVRVTTTQGTGGGTDTEGFRGVSVEIIDTGEGMDTAVRRRAKDPFFTTRPSGTGLGLAIVDRIVDAHGGRFEIDSRAGHGTRVTVHLPAASSDPPTSRPSRPEDGPPSTGALDG